MKIRISRSSLKAFASLCDSETGKNLNLQEGFIGPHKKKLSSVLIGLMNRTLSSDLVTEFVKQRRMIICTKAIESTSLLGPWWILRCVLLGDWYRFLGCIEFGLFVQSWKSITHPVTTFYAQCVAAFTISLVRRDERWIQLASNLLNDSSLLKYVAKDAKGDSILLANAIFIIRRTVQTYSGSAERHRKDILGASWRTLETVCKLDIGISSPELQHEFCGLWNQLVDAAQTGHRSHDVLISTRHSRIFASCTSPCMMYLRRHFIPRPMITFWIIRSHTPCARLIIINLRRSRTWNSTSRPLIQQIPLPHPTSCPCPPRLSPIHQPRHRPSHLITLRQQHPAGPCQFHIILVARLARPM